MRELLVVFICLVGMLVIAMWALTIMLAISSGKGLFSLFSHQPEHQWLSIPDTIAQYGDDQSIQME